MLLTLKRLFVSLAALTLLFLPQTLPASVGYLQLNGTPPPCTTRRFQGWAYSTLKKRLAGCPISRATSYYFSNSGNDSTGTGAIGSPYASIQKAQSVLEANPSGNIALLFARNSTFSTYATYTSAIASGATVGSTTVQLSGNWNIPNPADPEIGQTITLTGGTTETVTVTAFVIGTSEYPTSVTFTPAIANTGHTAISASLPSGLYIDAPNVTIASYGNGNRPNFSTFINAYGNANGFSTASSRSDNFLKSGSIADGSTSVNPVGWVKEASLNPNPYREMTSAQQVDLVPGSWWDDTTNHVMWIHCEDDIAPYGSGRKWSWSPENNGVGIYVTNVDGTRIDGIHVEGYGCRTPTSSPLGAGKYGIKAGVSGTNALVISNCESYYNANHAMGSTQGFGGFVTFYRDKAGLDTGYDTPYINYASNGGQETLCFDCECPIAGAPQGYVTGTTTNIVSFLNHQSALAFTASPATGQATATVSAVQNKSDGTTNTPILAGDSLILTGGTSETLTVASFNSATGVVTFTANIANSGHTGLTFASGPESGTFLSYSVGMTLCWGTRNTPGPYQSSVSFGSPAGAPRWTDLTNCRVWTVGEIYRAHPLTVSDYNWLNMPLNASAQSGATVTANAGAAAGIVGQGGGTAWLLGGSSVPEIIGINSVNAATGVYTLSGTPVGSSRTNLLYPAGPNGGFSPFPTSCQYAAYINCYFDCGANLTTSGVSNNYAVITAATPGPTTLFINDTFVADYSLSPNYTTQRYKGFFGMISTTPGDTYYNCRFHIKAAGRDTGCLDVNAANSGTVNQNVYENCIITSEGTESGAVPGDDNTSTTILNNAYGGFSTKTGQAGYDQDPYYVEVDTLPILGHPSPDSPLLTTHNQLIGGTYRLEYDADWNPRSLTTPAIGPYEPVQMAPFVPRDSQ